MKQWLRVVMVLVLVLMGFGGSVWACIPNTEPLNPLCVDNNSYPTEAPASIGDYRAPARQWHDSFGALAINPKGPYGYSSNQPSKAAAKQAALEDCGDNGCKIVSWYSNQCFAYAWGNGLAATGVDVDISKAEQNALASCSSDGRKCKIILSECSLPY